MRFLSGIIDKASGSVGGWTYSHNAGGKYIRSRSTPTDPNTNRQSQVRAIMASLVNHWSATLTAIQRAAWDTYAENVPLNDVFGDPRIRTGINHYVRSNLPRLQAYGTRVDDGPVDFNLGEFTNPGCTINVAGTTISVAFAAGDDWVGEDDSYMFVYMSTPKAPTVNFFKGPFQWYSTIVGNAAAPPAPPYEPGWPHVFAAGQKGFFRINVSRADGRLATPFLVGAVAA